MLETLRTGGERGNGIYSKTFLGNQPVLSFYDSDGINNQWQLNDFGYANPMAAPLLDPDGDEWINLAEYLAGTDPLDANDFLRPNFLRADNTPSELRLLDPMPYTRYQLQKGDLNNPWENVGSPILPYGGEEVIPIPIAIDPATSLFHRPLLLPNGPQDSGITFASPPYVERKKTGLVDLIGTCHLDCWRNSRAKLARALHFSWLPISDLAAHRLCESFRYQDPDALCHRSGCLYFCHSVSW